MNKHKTLLVNFVLLIVMLPEFSLHMVTPICQEAESREEICEIKEIKSNKKDYHPVDFFPDTDVPILTHSIHPLNSFVTLFGHNHSSTYLFFYSDLFNHSPPIL
ncbi:MAG: hypothetical protein DRP74_01000 [Candidatus Omnitrophota bacterium]|nr:MAG: hypothetical protein DRP74_01000 [Candidatus Omnitrophota bacterium]